MRAVDFRKQLHDLLRSTLTFLDPLSKANMDTTALFAHKIDWALLDDTSIDRKLRPLIDTKLESFLGAKEPELVDFILEAVLPKKDAAHDVVEPGVVLEEILVAFGEGEEERREAEAMVADVWRTVVWETEKARVADGREITGLEKPIEELEVAEVL